MEGRQFAGAGLIGLAFCLVLVTGCGALLLAPVRVEPGPLPVMPLPAPVQPKRPCLPNRPCPRDNAGGLVDPFAPVGAITLGGPVGPGGVEVVCDLPVSLRMKNTGGMGPRGPGSGAGLCVFTSIMHAARFQDERRLWDFQKQMMNLPGGGYPSKVDAMIARFGAGTPYLQYEGNDPTILELALRTGRYPSVTYDGRDPFYGPQRVAHMVNLAFLDGQLAAVHDNNHVQPPTDYVWMSRQEFLSRWVGGQNGWAVVLLSDAPPPAPRSK